MEVFTGGDHGLQNDVVLFPADTHLSPFTLPNSGDTFSDQHKISADHHRFLPPQPPQKLRPIRCNGRSFSSECCSSDNLLDAKPVSWPSESELYNNNNNNNNTETEATGFVPPKDSSTLGLSFQECQIEATLSSSSDEATKLQQEPINEPPTKKRKRKSRKKLESFIENMMKTVMEKQEEMHKQLIDILDKKENERIIREEAWKQQELERAKRDEKARSQEISRSLALISFIQTSLGQEIQIQIPNPNKQNENQTDEILKCDTGNDSDSNIKRWPKSEVQALITVRAALNQKFNHKGPKTSIWEEVAAGLSRMGYNRTPKKCKEKWENINKYYRRTMDKGKENGGSRSTQQWSYFSELEMLYKNGFISGNSHEEDQNTNEMH